MALSTILYNLMIQTEGEFVRSELVDEVLSKDDGLRAILALTGFSMASLRKIIHLARVCDDEDLRKVLKYEDWNIDRVDATRYIWEAESIEKLVRENAAFRAGVVKLFYEGIQISMLHDNFPPREIRRLSITRLTFEPRLLIQTIVDYGLYHERTRSTSEALNILSKLLE